MMEFGPTEIKQWLVGNLPVWTLLIIVIGYIALQWVKNKPKLEQIASDERLQIKTGYRETIQRLELAVKDCHEKSQRREGELQDEIDQLKQRINDEAWNRVQSEIGLVRILMDTVDAPQFRIIMAGLEKRATLLTREVPANAGEGAGDESEGA